MTLVDYLATTAIEPDRLTTLLLDPEGTLRAAGYEADALTAGAEGPEDPEAPKPPPGPHPDTIFVVKLDR